MSHSRLFTLFLSLSPAAYAQVDVGSGPISAAIQLRFRQAFVRDGFDVLCALPPLANVTQFGSTGLFQEFADAARTPNTRLALVKANTVDQVADNTVDVFQIRASMYSYYNSIGVNTAGYPTMDTAACPAPTTSNCSWQQFDRSYALFVFTSGTLSGTRFNSKEPFFSKWLSLNGITGPGPAISSEQSITAASGVQATVQTFSNSALYNITSGLQTGRLLAVQQPVYSFYLASNGHSGFLGLPTSDETVSVSGLRRQTFEGGSIEYVPGSTPVLRLPVSHLSVAPSFTPVRLKLGDTVTLQASVFAANGAQLDTRTVAWTTSDSRVLTLQPAGASVTVRAIGSGSARVTAISEGKSSVPVIFFVTAPCCQVGEGAPTAGIQQAFQDAVTRNRLALRLPGPSPVRRLGNGYVQELSGAEPNSSVRYLLAKADRTPAAYVLTGLILARYLDLGGPAGAPGYPTSDATAGGRQMFESGALAGIPVVRVTGTILARWAAGNFEAGPAGLPQADQEPFLTFRATAGARQVFRGGIIHAGSTGALAGRGFLVAGPVLNRYLTLGGVAGKYGMPVGEEDLVAGRRRQDFEGGFISYAPGATETEAQEIDRRPEITATPAVVTAGGRIRLAAGGFDTAATLRVSVVGQPDFVVRTETGAYVWEVAVPPNAPSATIVVRAADANGSAVAQGIYRVQSIEEATLRLVKLEGDAQTGLPAARLPQPMRVALRDEMGNPIPGASVRFAASPGARIEGAAARTDERGEAQAWLRLPASEAIALATAQAGGQVTTFTARAAAGSLTNFPRFTHPQDPLLAGAAGLIRHLQNLGELSQPLGAADPVLLDQFFRGFCLPDVQGGQICDAFAGAPDSSDQFLNLWRTGTFVNNGLDVSVEAARADDVRDLVAQGQGVLVALELIGGGQPAGAHFVTAIGVGANGGILIQDPSPAFGRTTLEEYLNGFTLAGRSWKATIAATVRLLARVPSPSGFLLTAGSAEFEVSSAAGPCGRTAAWPSVLARAAEIPSRAPGAIRFRYCDGLLTSYQLDVAGQGPREIVLTDLANPGSRFPILAEAPAAFRLSRVAQWTAAPQQTAFSAFAVVNAASFTPEMAPGGLAAVFGNGLSGPGVATTVDIGGMPALVIAATPFQVNFVIPLELAPGAHPLRIGSAFGVAEQTVEIRDVAPAILMLDARRAAVLNQDGSVNGPANPAVRSQVIIVFATGLGAVASQGSVQATAIPVSGLLEGQELETLFAGAAPGFPGLYQVNLRLTSNLPPGLNLRLRLRQGGAESSPVQVSVQ